MTAASYSTNLADVFTDATSGGGGAPDASWSGLGGGGAGLNLETDYFIQGSNCVSKSAFASDRKGMMHDAGSDQGGSGTDGAYLVWLTHLTPNSLSTKANSGISFLIGSATNAYREFYVAGSDTIEFGGWVLAAVNEGATADNQTGSPAAGVESHFGALFDLPSGGPTKGAPNAIDAIRRGRCDIVIEGGTAPDAAATFDGVLAALETPTLRYGLLAQREPGGAYEQSGLVQFGSAGSACRFIDADKSIFLRAHDHVTSNFHTWEVQNAASVVSLSNVIVAALNAVSPGRFLATDNATITLAGCSFIDLGAFSFQSNTTADSTFLRCGAVSAGGANLSGSTFSAAAVAANASAVVWDVATDPSGLLDDASFTMGAANSHAIEFGTSAPLSMTLNDVAFQGYGSGNNADNSTFHVRRTSGSVTINLIGCTVDSGFSYRTDGASVDLVLNPVDVSVECVDATGSPVSGVRVLVETAGAGPFPFEASISATQTAGTCTVTHSGHGLATGDYVVIAGAVESEYNGVKQITVVDGNSYTFTIDSGASTPATGSPIASYAVLFGVSGVDGIVSDTLVFTSDQDVVGTARKGTSSPFYKAAPISGTVSASSGLAQSAVMISDE